MCKSAIKLNGINFILQHEIFHQLVDKSTRHGVDKAQVRIILFQNRKIFANKWKKITRHDVVKYELIKKKIPLFLVKFVL